MTDDFHPRELAFELMQMGAAVLPLCADKSPVGHLVPEGFKNASRSADHLWWFEHNDTERVGLVPGTLGMLVLDVDVKHGVNGVMELGELRRANGWTQGWDHYVRTPTGDGKHIYLRKVNPGEHIGNHDLCKGVNVRADAGYVVAPGNPGYAFTKGSLDGIYQFPPDWVMQRLRDAATAVADARLDEPYSAPEARMEPPTEWHQKVFDAYESFEHDGDRHGTMTTAVLALANYELLGYAGSTRALEQLEKEFIVAIADRADRPTAQREYRRALEGARERVRANVSIGLEERDKDQSFVEWIKLNGGTDEDVERVLSLERPSALKLWTMSELMQSDLSLTWLVRNVLCTPTYGQVAGEKKTLKTYLSQYLAIAVATGYRFLDQFPVDKQGNVVMFVGEGGRIPWTRRMPRIAGSVGIDDIRDAPIYSVFQTAPILSPAFKATVEQAIEDLDPVLTIIDPFYSFHGAETNSANIHEEGALLTAAAAPFIEHGSNLLIVNHFKKGADSRGLNRITMAGSGEWVDSWFFTEQREEPDLNNGDFFIKIEFGSRQWGGSEWEIDFNIGRQDPMGIESDEPISFSLRRSYG